MSIVYRFILKQMNESETTTRDEEEMKSEDERDEIKSNVRITPFKFKQMRLDK
jgi:hypothetical protein